MHAKKENFKTMSAKEKKKFLAQDLAERIMRVEQRVSECFDGKIPYNETEYYKTMSASERKNFQNLLKKKRKKS